MRRIFRLPLSRKAQAWLIRSTRIILAEADPEVRKRKAAERWASRSRFDRRYQAALREILKRMASGIERCMYCEDGAGHPIEHFWPKSRFPERTFCWDNVLIACDECNNRCKGATFPLDARGKPLLIDPTAEDPADHLELIPREGRFIPRDDSPKGQETCRVLKLNARHTLVRGRINAWVGLEALIEKYAACQHGGDKEGAAILKRCICDYPFSSVLVFMLRVLDLANPERHLSRICLDALRAHHGEIRAWVTPLPAPV